MEARTWVEVDKRALAGNLKIFKKIAGKSRLMAVVKSNAYGHGMIECAKIFEKAGVGWVGVDDIDEALPLRQAGLILPMLVLGYTLPTRFTEAVKHDLSVTIASLETLRQIKRQNSKLKIHLKLETGLNRQGITEDELSQALKLLKGLKLEGVYSHFAADAPLHRDYCERQMKTFERMIKYLETRFPMETGFLKHMADSAASILLPHARYDMVRVGIGLYGLDPASEPLGRRVTKWLPKGLRPALSWYSVIAQVKNVKKGERVGYDLTERMARDSKLAIVPVGYWHGYPRALSGNNSKGSPWSGGVVVVRGVRCKVIGRISMDMMTIDVTDVSGVKAGDIVTLIGPGLPAEEVAAKAGTINYELVTRINLQVPRIYV